MIDQQDKNVVISQKEDNSENVTNKNQSETLEVMINNQTAPDKSVEKKRDSSKRLRSEEVNMEDMKKKNITRDSSLTDQELMKINSTEKGSIDKDLGNVKIDVNDDRKNLTMYLNKKMANKLHLVARSCCLRRGR